MAKNDWGDEPAAAESPADWGDEPAAKQALPADVQPSAAGAGRGSARDPRRLDRDRAAEIRQMDEATEPYSDPATALQRTPQPKPGAFDIPSVLDREGAVLPEPTLSPAQDQANLASSNRAAAERMAPVTGPVAREGDRQKPNRAEDQGRMLSDGGFVTRAAAKAGSAAARGAWGTVRAGADIVGADRVAGVAKEAAGATEDFERGMGKAVAPAGFGPRSPIGYLQEMGEGAASSLGTSAAFALAFGPKAVIPLMSIQSAGEKYDQARNQGLDPGMALANAVPTGAFEAIGEKFQGLDKAATALKVLMTRGSSQQAIKSAADALVASGVREIPGEVLTYLGQTGVDLLPGIGINQDLTMGEFLDGLRDTVVQAGMMGGATAAGGLVANRTATRMPRERSAEQIARDKGFLVEQERIDRVKTAGETGVATTLQQRLDKQRASSELENLADRPYGADPAFQQRYTELRTGGMKPAEASARAAMITGFTQMGEQAGLTPKALGRVVEAASSLPLDKVPEFLEKYATLLASKGIGTELPQGTVAGAVGALRDDAMTTALDTIYGDDSTGLADSPAATMAEIEKLEKKADTPAASAVDNIAALLGVQAADPAPVIESAEQGTPNASIPVGATPEPVGSLPAGPADDAGGLGDRGLRPDDTGGGDQPVAGALEPSGEPTVADGTGTGEQPAAVGPIGIDGQALSEGGKPYRDKVAAGKARKKQSHMRVVKVPGGFALVDKTPAQLAAEVQAAKRLRVPRMGNPGVPESAHEFLARAGGLRRETAREMSIEGNVRVGNRTLFAGNGRGLTIERATESLIEAGYLPQGSGHNQAYDLIRRSVSNPQYTPAGWEAIAEAEAQTRFEDHLAAAQEQEDPFAPLSDEELQGVGPLSVDQRDELDALIAAAEAEGIDTELLLEEAARLTQNGDDHDYRQQAIALIRSARTSRSETAAGANSEQGRPDAEPGGVQGGMPVPGQQGPARSEVAAPSPTQTPALAGVSASGASQPIVELRKRLSVLTQLRLCLGAA